MKLLRPCKIAVATPEREIPAYFHKLGQVDNHFVAIYEDCDGRLGVCPISNVRFTDQLLKKGERYDC